MRQEVFISHSSKDQKMAETICLALESRGIGCWIAGRDVNPGENFMQAIVRAIRTAKIMVLVFTSHANDSDEIKKELVLASQYKLVIMPVRTEDVLPDDALAYQFATAQWIDLFKDWEHQIERLSSRIANLLPAAAAADAETKPGPRPMQSPPHAAMGLQDAKQSSGANEFAPTPPWTPAQYEWWRYFEHHFRNLFGFLRRKLEPDWQRLKRNRRKVGFFLIALLALALFGDFFVVAVPSGHVGVMWKRFGGPGIYCWCFLGRGTVLDPQELRDEGSHVVLPWDKLFIYDLRLQSITQTYNAISADGVYLNATIDIRFQLRHNSVAVLHKFIGPSYVGALIRPELGGRVREIIVSYTTEQIYATQRIKFETEIREAVQKKLREHLDLLLQPEGSEQGDHEKYADQLKQAIDFIDTLVLSVKQSPKVAE